MMISGFFRREWPEFQRKLEDETNDGTLYEVMNLSKNDIERIEFLFGNYLRKPPPESEMVFATILLLGIWLGQTGRAYFGK